MTTWHRVLSTSGAPRHTRDPVSIPRGTPHSFRVETQTARFLTIHTPAGHERFYRAGGDPAPQRTLPPPGVADVPRLLAAGQQHGVQFLGPPPTTASA